MGSIMTAKGRPADYPTVLPLLNVKEAAGLRAFLERVFDARIRVWEEDPDGTLRCAEARIGDSCLMIGEADGKTGERTGALWVYVADADACHARALAAGAASLAEPADQYYGDRKAGVIDPFGNLWWIGTRVEDLAPEDIDRRIRERAAGRPAPPARE